MSTPTHDPLVVNTQDGCCWMRRAVTRGGKGLYALAGTVSGAPDMVLATLADLAEHHLASVAFAMPMPVGPEPRTLALVEDELTGVSLSLYEEELETARLRLALASAQRGRRELRAQVVELLAERHSTNEALDDAVRELRARPAADGITRRIAPTQALREDEPSEDVSPRVAELRDLLAGQRAALEDRHDGELAHKYRLGRDLEYAPPQYTPATTGDVVAYRDPQRPQTLLCREHGPRYIGMLPVTAEDLPDGGMCTYGGLSSLACGRDVLAAERTTGGA
jgi:hypothetical protein